MSALIYSITGAVWAILSRRKERRESFGIEVLDNKLKSPKADICFVHGISGDENSTWSSASSDGTYEFWWPARLQEDFNVRILMYRYSTSVPTAEYLARRTLFRQAEYLVGYLANERKDDPERPLIFIAHSLGGLVVKSALILSSQSLEETKDSEGIALSTAGIVFLGTPHNFYTGPKGCSDNILQKIARASGLSSRIITHLDEESQALQTDLEPFEALGTDIPMVSFFETLKTEGFEVLVPKPSAKLDVGNPEARVRTLRSDHANLARFHGPKDMRYRRVAKEISKLCQNAVPLVARNWKRYYESKCESGQDNRLNWFQIPSQLPPQSPYFTGRSNALKWIEDVLLGNPKKNGIDCRTVNFYGPGGCGKTEVALAFAHGYRNNFSSVFWIHSRTRTAIEEGFFEIAKILGLRTLRAREEISARESVYWVLEWLKMSGNANWLLIFDDLEVPTAPDIIQLIPSTTFHHGHAIITSRYPLNNILVREFRIGPLFQEESVTLLKKYLGPYYPDELDLEEVSKALKNFPLALSMAGGYMKRYGISPSQFLKQHSKQPPVPSSVAESIAKISMDPAELLFSICCLLTFNPIPLWIFTQGSAPFLSKKTLQQCISRLEECGLILYQPAKSHILVLRQVRDDGQRLLSKDLQSRARRDVCETASYVADSTSQNLTFLPGPYVDTESLKMEVVQLIIDALVIIKSHQISSQEWDIDCEELGKACQAYGKINEAVEFYNLHLKRKKKSEESIPRVKIRQALSRNMTGETETNAEDTGSKSQAQADSDHMQDERKSKSLEEHVGLGQLFREAVEAATVDKSLQDLRSLNCEQQDPEQELEVLRMIIEAQQTRFDPNSSSTLETIQEASRQLIEQGFLDEAEARLRRILTSYHKFPSMYHSHRDRLAETLVSICLSLGKLDEAEAICHRTVGDYVRRLGPDHPFTQRCSAQLAWIYSLQGYYSRADQLFKHAIDTLTRTEGPDHADVLRIEQNYASNMIKQNRLREGQDLLHKVLRRMEAHPTIYSKEVKRRVAIQLAIEINEDLTIRKGDELWEMAMDLEGEYNMGYRRRLG